MSYTTSDPGYYKIELWGASGGGTSGGKGAYTSGVINLNSNEKLYIYIGSSGGALEQANNNGGYNGGGISGDKNTNNSYGGGGATDIRYFNTTPTNEDLEWNSFNGLKSRIMVAAGGGGSTSNIDSKGGYAGDQTGGNGSGTWTGSWTRDNVNYIDSVPKVIGATQISGGTNNYQNTSRDGSFGFGIQSNGGNRTWGGGGGGGYFGGAQGLGTGGSGGSSYISGYTGCIAITGSSTQDNVQKRSGTDNAECVLDTTDNLCSKHYSNKYFIGNSNDFRMLSGDKEIKSPNGALEIGHTGNGHARIIYLGETYTS